MEEVCFSQTDGQEDPLSETGREKGRKGPARGRTGFSRGWTRHEPETNGAKRNPILQEKYLPRFLHRKKENILFLEISKAKTGIQLYFPFCLESDLNPPFCT